MSLWDKKDSLYIEANTLNVADSHFYHYYLGYSEFFKNEPLGFSLYIPDDTDKNNIKFNYTLKDVNWHEYLADEMEEEIFLFQDKYDNDETGYGRGLIPIVVASNGGGEQSALLFQIKSANGDENVSPQFGFMAQDIERIFAEEKLDVGSLVDEVELEDNEIDYYVKKLGYNPLPDKKRKSVAYTEFIPILWSFAKYHKDAINELRVENDRLKKEIDDIKSKMED